MSVSNTTAEGVKANLTFFLYSDHENAIIFVTF